MLDAADRVRTDDPNASVPIVAKTNGIIAAISRAARERHKAAGLIISQEVSFEAATVGFGLGRSKMLDLSMGID